MGKRVFFAFLLLIAASTTFVILYIQSAQFANFLKGRFANQIESELGLVIDFERLSIQAIPPGVAIVKPVIREIKKNNILKIPTDAMFQASQIGLNFRMFQTFGNRLVVNRFYLKDAIVKLAIETKEKNAPAVIDAELIRLLSKPINIRLESGFELDIRQIELKESQIELYTRGEKLDRLSIKKIKTFALRPEHSLYSSIIDLEGVSWSLNGKEETIDSLKANFEIDPNTVKIISLDFTRPEINLHLGGTFQGDISEPKKMKGAIRVIGRATAAGLAKINPTFEKIKGTYGVELLIEGTMSSYSIKGKIDGTNISYNLWNVDRTSVEFEADKNDLRVKNLKLVRKKSEILLEPFSVTHSSKELNTTIRLQFKNVNFQDFTGDLKYDVNNLEMLMNGSADLGISLVAKNTGGYSFQSMLLKPNLKISNLELNNQIWGKLRAKRVTLRVKELELTGDIGYNGESVEIGPASLKLPTGSILVNGTIHPSKGWDLIGYADSVDVGSDIGEIAENPLRGVGSVRIGVKGPASNIFLAFDMDLKNASYVNMELGDLKGKITYDDKDSKLVIKDAKGTMGIGNYEVDGIVDVSGEDLISLRIKIVEMKPDHLLHVFKYQLRSMTWIPSGISGKLSATASLGGKFTDPENTFDLRGRIDAKNLLIQNEMINSLVTDFSLKGGVYAAENIVSRKYNSRIIGNVSYGPGDFLQYKFDLERGRLRDLDYISRSGMPINASVSMSGWGKGPSGKIKSHAELRAESVHVGTFNMPPVFLRYDTDEEQNVFQGVFGDQNNRLRVRQMKSANKNSELEAQVSGDNFSFLICILNQEYCADKNAQLSLGISISSNWPGNAWQSMNGTGRISKAALESSEFKLALSQEVPFTINNGWVAARQLPFLGTDTKLNLGLEGKVDGTKFSTTLNGDLGLQSVSIITPVVSRAKGVANIESIFRGSVDDLRMSGRVLIQNGSLLIKGISPGIEDIEGKFNLAGNRLRIERLQGSLGQGKASFDGGISLYLNKAPSFSLGVNLQDNRIRFEPLSIAEIDRGRLSFVGDAPPYTLGGKIKIKKAILRDNFDLKRKSLRNAKYLPSESAASSSIYNLRIEVVADSGMLVQNDLIDAEFKGGLLLQNNFNFPRITGNAELVRGKLLFRSIPFELDHAVIKQTNADVLNPWFSLGGAATVSSYKVTIFANGYSDDPKISLGSSPPLPQEDVLSLLAFGYIERKDASIRSDDTNAVTYTEVGSILLDQLRLNKDLKSRGLNVRVTPLVVEREANIIRPRTVPESALPKIQVQTQVIKNVDASLGTSVGSAQSQFFDMNVEYHLSDKISVQSVYEQEPGADAGETRTSVGGDLKFRWGFK
jgi:hypothetical protein